MKNFIKQLRIQCNLQNLYSLHKGEIIEVRNVKGVFCVHKHVFHMPDHMHIIIVLEFCFIQLF